MTIATRAARTILALCLLTACGGAPQDRETPAPPPTTAPSAPPAATGASLPPPELAGTSWLLQRMDGQPVQTDLGSMVSFRRAGGVQGFGACNGYMGPLTVTGDRLTVGPLQTTRRACAQPAMEQERRFLDSLAKAERFAVAGTNLSVHVSGHDQPLEFTRLGEPPPPAR